MLKVEITDRMKKVAKEKAEEMGELKNSILKGQGNVTGFLGEEIIKSFLSARSSNTKDYDISYKKKKYDIKTKLTSKEPLPEYDCSIAAYNTVQKCDGYIFVRIQKDKEDNLICGWILGWMDKEAYFQNAEYWPKGKIDPSNGYRVKASCYNIKIKDLKNIEELKNDSKVN
jgi:hypothetical protein